MSTQVPLEVTIGLAILTSVITLLAALGSQIITASANLKVKRMELLFKRKADAYVDFMIKAGIFAYKPEDEQRYVQYVHAYESAPLLASKEVE